MSVDQVYVDYDTDYDDLLDFNEFAQLYCNFPCELVDGGDDVEPPPDMKDDCDAELQDFNMELCQCVSKL